MRMLNKDVLKRRNLLKLMFGGFVGSGAYALTERTASAAPNDPDPPLATQNRFPTLSELRSVEDPHELADIDIVVLNHHSENDRGGGTFRWAPNAHQHDDNAIFIRPDSVAADQPGRFQRVFSGDVNVCWFGARGDDDVDDSIAFQAAIDWSEERGGGVIRVPPGAYICNNVVLKNGVTLSSTAAAYGYSPSKILGASLRCTKPGFCLDTPETGVTGAGVTGINFRGGGPKFAAGGIRFQKASWCAIKVAQFDNFSDEAIVIDAGMACVIEDVLTTNVLLNRARPKPAGAITLAGTDHYLSRVESNTSLHALSSDGPERIIAAFLIRGANHFISNCVGEISDVGYIVEGLYHRFTGCRGDRNWGEGFIINCKLTTFSSCTALDNNHDPKAKASGFLILGPSNTFASCIAASNRLPSLQLYGFDEHNPIGDVERDTLYAACRSLNHGIAAQRCFTAKGKELTFADVATRSGAEIR